MESFVCAAPGEPSAISDELQAELRRMEERLKITIKSEVLAELASQSGGVVTGGVVSGGPGTVRIDLDIRGENGTSASKDEESSQIKHTQDTAQARR